MDILYLETNFLIGLALKQDPGASELVELAIAERSFQLAFPQVCFMEALTAVTRRVEERARLHRAVEADITQLRRSPSSSQAANLLSVLNDVLVTSEEYLN